MEIEQWRLKRTINHLNSMEGQGTSMISLLIPPSSQGYEGISRVVKMLSDEMGTAVNIKSRVNRLSVQSAITSVIQKLKTFSHVPPNGLALFFGTIEDKKTSITISPFRPILTSLYLCDSKFHTEGLSALLVNDDVYGFIIIDGNGCFYFTLQGDNRTLLRKYEVDLPKKHSKGGQSSQRFGRIRLEKRQNYVTKSSEFVTQQYITNNLPNVKGLILAGSADFKHQLLAVLDPRLVKIVIGVVDVSYGGENGMSQAIELSSNLILNSKYIHEKKLIEAFMTEISKNTGKFCYGMKETMFALENGAVETLIVWEQLELKKDDGLFVDWIAEHYKDYGCVLELISNSSGEGSQFVMGFGGIGGILRYPVELPDDVEEKKDQDLEYDEDFM